MSGLEGLARCRLAGKPPMVGQTFPASTLVLLATVIESRQFAGGMMGMTKFPFLAVTLLVVGSLRAQQPPDYSKVQIKVTKVSGNIYMLEGAGGNIAASLGEDGILIVDTEYSPLADKIQV